MTWLLITLTSYLIFAVVFLIDKYLLVSSIRNPKVYAFYIGVLGIGGLLLIPFIDFLYKIKLRRLGRLKQ